MLSCHDNFEANFDNYGVVDRVAVKAAHSGEILPVLIALEQLLDAIFDAVNDLPHPVFVGLFFSHDDLLSEKIAPLRRRKHILHRGDSPHIDVVSSVLRLFSPGTRIVSPSSASSVMCS